jgi:hypothetical protein
MARQRKPSSTFPPTGVRLRCERCSGVLDIWMRDSRFVVRGSDRGRIVDEADLELDDGKAKHVAYRCKRCGLDVVLYTPGIFSAWQDARRRRCHDMQVGDDYLVGFYEGERIEDSEVVDASEEVADGHRVVVEELRLRVPNGGAFVARSPRK